MKSTSNQMPPVSTMLSMTAPGWSPTCMSNTYYSFATQTSPQKLMVPGKAQLGIPTVASGVIGKSVHWKITSPCFRPASKRAIKWLTRLCIAPHLPHCYAVTTTAWHLKSAWLNSSSMAVLAKSLVLGSLRILHSCANSRAVISSIAAPYGMVTLLLCLTLAR